MGNKTRACDFPPYCSCKHGWNYHAFRGGKYGGYEHCIVGYCTCEKYKKPKKVKS